MAPVKPSMAFREYLPCNTNGTSQFCLPCACTDSYFSRCIVGNQASLCPKVLRTHANCSLSGLLVSLLPLYSFWELIDCLFSMSDGHSEGLLWAGGSMMVASTLSADMMKKTS